MIGRDLIYDNKQLTDFGMAMFDPDTEQTFVDRNVITGTPTQNKPIINIRSVAYADTLQIPFFICKDTERKYFNGSEILSEEIDEIRAWLESSKEFKELCVISNRDEYFYFNGIFTSVQPYFVAGTCYGLKLNFKCDSPFGYTEPYTKCFNLTNGECLDFIDNCSCEKDDYLYPLVKVYSNNVFNEEEIIIENLTDNNAMKFILPAGKSIVEFDCMKKTIKDENGNNIKLCNLGINTSSIASNNLSSFSFLFYWFRLLPNNNDIKVTAGNSVSKVEIIAKFPTKAGEF